MQDNLMPLKQRKNYIYKNRRDGYAISPVLNLHYLNNYTKLNNKLEPNNAATYSTFTLIASFS